MKDESGKLITDLEEKLELWKAYIKDFCQDDIGEKPDLEGNTDPTITTREAERAISLMKNGNETGSDNIPVEVIKLFNSTAIKQLPNFFNAIYYTGKFLMNGSHLNLSLSKKDLRIIL